jgi:hypothetical protein
MPLLPSALTRPAGRLGATAQNALGVARFGGLETGEEPSPYEIVAEHRVFRLRRDFTHARRRWRGQAMYRAGFLPRAAAGLWKHGRPKRCDGCRPPSFSATEPMHRLTVVVAKNRSRRTEPH